MRLSPEEHTAIVSAVSHYVRAHGGSGALFLFGSRVDDSLGGGDIDLLLVLDSANAKIKDYEIKVEIKAAIGEQRVDLITTTRGAETSTPFLRSISEGAVLLGSV